MAEMKVRDYLKGRGFKDDEITYNNGNVYAKGKQFYGATPQADGSTYGDPNKLNQAFNAYNMNDALDTFKTNLSKPRETFSYNAQSDPLYQNALQAAQRSAQTAGNNASVRLGARGIGNSQQALTTENQIHQRSVADVNSNLLPQYMAQAYNQYKDRYAMDQDALKNQLNLASTYNNLGQQSFSNDRLLAADAEQKKQNNWDAYLQSVSLTGDLGTGAKEDYNLLGTRSGNLTMAGQGYKDDIAQRGIENTRADRQLNANLANMSADNARANAAAARSLGNDEMALRFDAWDRTGRAPAGIPGVAEGTPLAGKTASKPTTYKEMPEFESSKAFIYANPSAALKEIQDNRDTLIKDYGTDGYGELLALAKKLDNE